MPARPAGVARASPRPAAVRRRRGPVSLYFTHVARGPVARYEFKTYGYHVLYLPDELKPELPLDEHPRLRIDAEVNGVEHTGTWMPAGGGDYYLMLSKRLLKETGLEPGETATVRFRVADQNAVDVPEELEQALSQRELAREAWDDLPVGKRRNYAYRVSSAKREETRFRRTAAVIEELIDRA